MLVNLVWLAEAVDARSEETQTSSEVEKRS